jgi:energy-coupling factor transport system ATP-binding protein
MIAQRPDAQVVGLRVRDDVVWGLPADHGVDLESLLRTVGLDGMAADDTATLSGGQLQRLAVAAALARRPRLLISDESTAMIDPDGRDELIGVFAQLPRRWPMSVVHITHNVSEVASADRVIRLEHGRVVQDTVSAVSPRAIAPRQAVSVSSREALPSRRDQLDATREETAPLVVGPRRDPSLTLNGLGHVYAYGTVWERRALSGVSLVASDGDGLMFAGDNGSGKSTLAWIIAGLLRPTDGACRLDGVPTHRNRGRVAIAFQHARLQLQRPTVGQDIADAAGLHALPQGAHHSGRGPADLDARTSSALRAVGLDPGLAARSIEQLSGGQQRRVAIAGLLARNPRVLILDEPLAGLDAPTRLGLAELLMELRERAGLTLIVVTHDPEPLATVCPRVVRLDHGRIVEDTGAEVLPTDLENTAA